MNHHKLRIKHPSGAEFEAEGPAEFILNEKRSFLESLPPAAAKKIAETHTAPPETELWDKIADRNKGLLKLRIKTPDISAAEAALILMAASRALNLNEDPSAIILSKALKTSGYEPDRLDRLLSKEIKEGRITASGTKRSRSYKLTQKGLAAATMAAIKMLPASE